MSILKSIAREVVGFACEMLTIRDPLDKPVEVKVLRTYEKQNVDFGGHPREGTHTVTVVQANNYRDLERLDCGNPAGARSTVHVKTGRNTWEIDTVEWDV